ncbi:integrase, catalytic region, zinc finger, CCHC-type containing protein [Tanacetum coccineum]
MTELPLVDSSFAVPIFSPGDDRIAYSRVTVQQVQGRQGQSYSSTCYKSNATSSRGNSASGQARVVKCYNYQGEGHMARQCTQPKRPRNATWYKDKAMLAEAQEAGQILDEEQLAFLADPGVPDGQAVQTIIPNNVAFQTEDLDTYDSDCYQNPFYLKKAQRIKPTLYDGIVISDKHVAMPVIDDEETLILEEESRSKILTEDFGKRFTSQQELSVEQAFWLRISNPTNESSNKPPVKVEVLNELPKVSLVNASLKKLKFFDSMVKKRTTPNACAEGEWGFEHTKAVFNNEIIPFLKSLKDIFNVFNKDLLNEIMEVRTVFDQMEAVIQQSSVDKQCLEIAKKELLLENGRILQQIMSQDVLLTVMNSMSLNGESMNMEIKRNESCDKCFNLDVELLKSQNAHNDLLKRKEIVDIAAQTPSAYTIVPGMFQLDIEPLAPRSYWYMLEIHALMRLNLMQKRLLSHPKTMSRKLDIPSSSSLAMTSCPDCSLVSGLWMFETYDREPLLAHELC